MILATAKNIAMNMMKPNIYEPYAFDATQDYIFEFSYTGSQAQHNKIVIRDNASNKIVFEDKIRTMELKHKIPAGTLTNGGIYKATVFVYDTFENQSPESDAVIFFCFTQPVFTITNLTPNAIVNNSSYEVEFAYQQIEGEPLNSYQVLLYNSLGEIIAQSGNRYPNMDDDTEPVFTYNLTSLDDNTEYSVQILGETLNHMVADTGRVVFTVEYINPAVFAILDLTNIEREGQIKIQSNIVSIVGHSYPDPPLFIDDMEVDTRGNDEGGQHRVWFDEGFNLQRDFTLQILMRDPNDYSTFLEFGAYPINLELKYMKGVFDSQNGKEMAYISLRVYNQLTAYYLQSNYFEPLAHPFEYLHVWLRCVKDVYELIAEPLPPTYPERFFYLDMSPLDKARLG